MPDIERLKETVAAGKFDPAKQSVEYEFQRGWNAALEWVEEKIAGSEKETEGKNNADIPLCDRS